jgi:hypothetical protein
VIAPPPEVCDVEVCDGAPTRLWQRYLNPREYAQLLATPLAPIDGVARIAVRGCGTHAMPEHLAHFTHRPDCPWPSPCSCGPADAPVVYTKVLPTPAPRPATAPPDTGGPQYVSRRAG